MNPLDFTGPTFLAFYVVAVFVAHRLGLVLRLLCRRQAGADEAPYLLSPYEAAMLAGGSARAVDVALVRLLRQDHIAADGKGGFVPKQPPGSPGRGLEHDVYRVIPGKRDLETIRSARLPALAPISGRLRQLGLLLSPGTAEATCLRVLTTLPLVAVAGLGITKIFVGMARGRPVSFLVLLVVVTAVIIVVKLVRLPDRSAKGERALQQMRRDNAALEATASRRSASLADSDLLLAAALFGPSAVAAGEFAWMRDAFVGRKRADSGGSSCSSGSGCGGSSCGGGGGCGGCGG